MKNKTVCFTGHRKIPYQKQKEIQDRLKTTLKKLINDGYCYFGCGGALGFDTLSAQAVLDLREEYPQIKLILVLPCLAQTRGWNADNVRMYEYIKCLADKVIYTSQNYFNGCMQKRNRHLVDNSSVCVCYLIEEKGGTFYTINYAKKNNLTMVPLCCLYKSVQLQKYYYKQSIGFLEWILKLHI